MFPGGVLHGHLPLPDAGGAAGPGADAAGGHQRDQVLPLPGPYQVGGPSSKYQTLPPFPRPTPGTSLRLNAVVLNVFY